MKTDAHQRLVGVVCGILASRGYRVSTEVPLERGAGAADVVAEKGKERLTFEVKSAPTSIRKGKVQRQLGLYRGHFGGRCFLATPDGDGNVLAHEYEGNYSGSLANLI